MVQSQRSPRDREVADRAHWVGKGCYDKVYLVPILGGREVLSPMVKYRRAGFVEGRAVTLPATIGGKADVTRARLGIIIREYGDTVKYFNEGRRNIHREVGGGLGQCRTRNPVGARH